MKETFIFLFFGSIIGTIALIGQIYHLESHLFKSLSLWLVIGTPIILFSETKYVAHAWAIILTYCSFMAYDFYFPSFITHRMTHMNLGYVPLVLTYAFALLRYAAPHKPRLAEAVSKYGILVFGGVVMFLGSFRWVENLYEVNFFHSTCILVLSLPIVFILCKIYSRFLGLLFFLSIGFLEFPNLFIHDDLKIISALYFLFLWGMFAYYGVKANERKIFELACLVISIRIIVIYFEVFGSLLQTGLGLVGSGLFILLVGYLWHSRREKIWGIR